MGNTTPAGGIPFNEMPAPGAGCWKPALEQARTPLAGGLDIRVRHPAEELFDQIGLSTGFQCSGFPRPGSGTASRAGSAYSQDVNG